MTKYEGDVNFGGGESGQVDGETGQAAAGAETQLAAAGSETGTQQAGAGSIGRQAVSAIENIADIGQGEFNLNAIARKTRNAEDFDQAIRAIELQTVANNASLANRQNQMAANHDQFALDRQWNVDEVAQASIANSIANVSAAAAVAAVQAILAKSEG